MYHSVSRERRKAVGGMLLSVALTSFLTGVTEPIEFMFMFLAPGLYALHAVLTGVSMVVMDLVGAKLGFGFSAGLFDYVLGFGLATRPLLLLPVGIVYFAIYYFSFRWCIRRFNLKTPGRDQEDADAVPIVAYEEQARGPAFVAALGGAANIRTVDACMTRLRLTLDDPTAVDEQRLKGLGAKGVVRPGGPALQVVLGPVADQVAGEIRSALRAPSSEDTIRMAWLQAFGGASNLRSVHHSCSRLIVALFDSEKLDEPSLKKLGVRAITHRKNGPFHVLTDLRTAEVAAKSLSTAPLEAHADHSS